MDLYIKLVYFWRKYKKWQKIKALREKKRSTQKVDKQIKIKEVEAPVKIAKK